MKGLPSTGRCLGRLNEVALCQVIGFPMIGFRAELRDERRRGPAAGSE